MSIASEITDLNANLAAAKTAVTTAGGTVGDTGLAGLASEIGTIPTGGAFDWGSITYDDNGTSRTATLRGLGDFMSLCGTSSTRAVTAGAATTTIDKVTGVTVGTDVDGIPDNFLRAAAALTSLSLPSGVKSIGSYFLAQGTFNFPITLPSSLKSIGNYFMSQCQSFNSSITLPSGIESIGVQFMAGCTLFNQSVDLSACTSLGSIANNFLQACNSFNSSITLPNTITSIENNFLQACTSFNFPITLPSGLTTIGTNFLANCTSFNSSITLPSGLTTVGGSFLSGCTSFNFPITLPSGLTTIGTNFLASCISFNKDITLPDTITSIGASFLYNVNSMTSTVYTGNLSPSVAASSNNSFSTIDSSADSYVSGIKMNGSYSTSWVSRFPDRTTSPFRKIVVMAGTLTTTADDTYPLTWIDLSVNLGGDPAYPADITLDCGVTVARSEVRKLDLSIAPMTGTYLRLGASRNGFLYNCTNFNELILPPTATAIQAINTQYFMYQCSSFNQPLVIASGSNTIYSHFLEGLTSLNSNIRFDGSFFTINDYFMYNCNAMTANVFLRNIEASAFSSAPHAFCTTDANAPCYTTGISISGTYASAVAAALPDSAASPYRKLNVV